MNFIDTHTHLYLEEFNSDRSEVVQNTIDAGITKLLLPNIDSNSIDSMMNLVQQFPKNCFPMIGLHPGSVNQNYLEELNIIEQQLNTHNFIAIGEIGIDLYWDKTYKEEQIKAFQYQINLAQNHQLPIIIHSRNAFDEIFDVLENNANKDYKGIFHCFSGSVEQANRAIDLGFLLGIGGVVTYKNSGLDKIVQSVDLNKLVLETDSPYLTPVPFRGKRNESKYIINIAEKIATLKNTDLLTVAEITSNNANNLFKI
ncbi:MAG: TatD family hydrolase [Paludibacter sp.]